MWLLPRLQIFQQGNLCTLIVQLDPNMFLRRNLCMKICLFVEQHRHTFHSHKQYTQCSPVCFDKIHRGNLCKCLIQWILPKNHQIFLPDKVCCLVKKKKKSSRKNQSLSVKKNVNCIKINIEDLPIDLSDVVVVFAKGTIHAVV